MEKRFTWLANATARLAGSAGAFLVAVVLILAWGMSGAFFGYSETWPLVINTGTTIITFLMVFLVQNTQNRDGIALGWRPIVDGALAQGRLVGAVPDRLLTGRHHYALTSGRSMQRKITRQFCDWLASLQGPGA